MTAHETAAEIEHQRFLAHNAAKPALERPALCEAAGVIVAALEVAQERTSRWRWVARAGLALAIQALKAYRARWCGEPDAA